MTTAEKKNIEIRASGLPGLFDCERKWAAQMGQDPRSGFKPVMESFGFEMPKKTSGIGATIGTACHDAFGQLFQARLDGYSLDPEPLAVAGFKKLDDGSIEYDTARSGVTKDQGTAIEQVKRMVQAYAHHALNVVRPARVEFKLEVEIADGYILSGHPDIYEVDGSIRDMKFGRNMSPYEPQLGAYRLMARSHDMEANKLFIDHVKRSTVNKPQPPLEITEYNVQTAEVSAHRLIERAHEAIEKFKASGDPWSFKANPSTNLCSKKWCPAWGSGFCDLGRPGKDDE